MPVGSMLKDAACRLCCRLKRADYSWVYLILDVLVRRVLGTFLMCLAYTLLGFMAMVTFGIVLPYEALHLGSYFMLLLAIYAAYLFVNIVYHYFKASTTDAGTIPYKSSLLPQCYRCDNYKPPNASHCSICDKCIVNMDHHCPWINKCVGANNHRHFLQFLAFMTIGCASFVLVAYRQFYWTFWHPSTNRAFCASELDGLPWFDWLCDEGGHRVITAMFFSYFLCSLIFWVVGGILYWKVCLISHNITYLGILKQQVSGKQIFQMILHPLGHADFKEN